MPIALDHVLAVVLVVLFPVRSALFGYRKLTRAEQDQVVDECFQCKKCYVVCPYTPDQQHEWQLDFPRLMLRATALRKKESGRNLTDQMLGRTDLLGKLGTAASPIAMFDAAQAVHCDDSGPRVPRDIETQPAPMVGRVFNTQSTMGSDGLSMTIFVLFSEPPPLAAQITSTWSPGTISVCTTAGVLSLEFLRAPAGSSSTEARSLLSGSL